MTNNYIWLNENSQRFLEMDYLLPGQTVDQRVDIICNHAEKILGKPGWAARFKKNVQKGWYSFSSPVWTNFGTTRGMAISCFGSMIDDSMKSILQAHYETGMMSKYGGGTSGYFGNIRGRGSEIKDNGTSNGSVNFMKLFETMINVVSQGSSRRGQFAAYQHIDHVDIMEFLTIRSDGHFIQNMSTGVCVTDDFMDRMISGNQRAREVWAAVLSSRAKTGYPYIFWVDSANRNAPDVYRDKGMKITHSNLCVEISLPDSCDESFVCDLGAMNIRYFDSWENTDAVELMIQFLDAVMTDFIDLAKDKSGMERAVRFAERHRALGLGWLGWHDYLQYKMIPFETLRAKQWNVEIAQTIQRQALAASKSLADEYGEPELLKGYGRRNTTVTAIMPTKSSSFILGQTSEGIEPHRSNFYIKDLQKGKFTVRNQQLAKVLAKRGEDRDSVWQSILNHGGSVQHLDCLLDVEKAVFKTFAEISPKEIIIQAAQRQKYICQSQSLNLLIDPGVPAKDVNALMIEAWRLGVKSLYYQISKNAAQQLSRSILTCSSCEG